jgi:hypothetical protein
MSRLAELHVKGFCILPLEPIEIDIGDVLIRHPWALHRGSPNTTAIPRPLVAVRYVRRWYANDSREVNAIPASTRASLTPEEQRLLRFPVAHRGVQLGQ